MYFINMMHGASKFLCSENLNLETLLNKDLLEMFSRKYIRQNWPTL